MANREEVKGKAKRAFSAMEEGIRNDADGRYEDAAMLYLRSIELILSIIEDKHEFEEDNELYETFARIEISLPQIKKRLDEVMEIVAIGEEAEKRPVESLEPDSEVSVPEAPIPSTERTEIPKISHIDPPRQKSMSTVRSSQWKPSDEPLGVRQRKQEPRSIVNEIAKPSPVQEKVKPTQSSHFEEDTFDFDSDMFNEDMSNIYGIEENTVPTVPNAGQNNVHFVHPPSMSVKMPPQEYATSDSSHHRQNESSFSGIGTRPSTHAPVRQTAKRSAPAKLPPLKNSKKQPSEKVEMSNEWAMNKKKQEKTKSKPQKANKQQKTRGGGRSTKASKGIKDDHAYQNFHTTRFSESGASSRTVASERGSDGGSSKLQPLQGVFAGDMSSELQTVKNVGEKIVDFGASGKATKTYATMSKATIAMKSAKGASKVARMAPVVDGFVDGCMEMKETKQLERAIPIGASATVGAVLGGVAGAYVAGPVGAAVGATIGGKTAKTLAKATIPKVSQANNEKTVFDVERPEILKTVVPTSKKVAAVYAGIGVVAGGPPMALLNLPMGYVTGLALNYSLDGVLFLKGKYDSGELRDFYEDKKEQISDLASEKVRVTQKGVYESTLGQYAMKKKAAARGAAGLGKEDTSVYPDATEAVAGADGQAYPDLDLNKFDNQPTSQDTYSQQYIPSYGTTESTANFAQEEEEEEEEDFLSRTMRTLELKDSISKKMEFVGIENGEEKQKEMPSGTTGSIGVMSNVAGNIAYGVPGSVVSGMTMGWNAADAMNVAGRDLGGSARFDNTRGSSDRKEEIEESESESESEEEEEEIVFDRSKTLVFS